MLIQRNTVFEFFLKHKGVVIVSDLNLIKCYFNKSSILRAPTLFLKRVIKGKEDIFLVGKVDFLEIGFPRTVVVKRGPNQDFDLVVTDTF